MDLVLGIDLGTSYFKLGLFDRAGQLRGLGRVLVEKNTEQGRCELAVDSFWSLLREGLAQACEEAGARCDQIRAVGYSSQANSFVLLDANSEPLTPLVLWPDRRVEEVDPAIQSLWQRKDFLATTALGMDVSPGFLVSKLHWFSQRQPEVWVCVKRIMTISDYLTHALTGQAVGDMGTAALLGLLDLAEVVFESPPARQCGGRGWR